MHRFKNQDNTGLQTQPVILNKEIKNTSGHTKCKGLKMQVVILNIKV